MPNQREAHSWNGTAVSGGAPAVSQPNLLDRLISRAKAELLRPASVEVARAETDMAYAADTTVYKGGVIAQQAMTSIVEIQQYAKECAARHPDAEEGLALIVGTYTFAVAARLNRYMEHDRDRRW
jgi:hypothetical protein